MRTYIGRVDSGGLRRFMPEDGIPFAVLDELVRDWASPSTAVIEMRLAQDDAELIRREIVADRPDVACTILLNRALELIPLRPAPASTPVG